MSTKAIDTSYDYANCDVCGRTLLRGEHPETFIGGGHRYLVCELCKGHALHEGWMREGSMPEYPEHSPTTERRRALFRRFRSGRERSRRSAPQTLDQELSIGDWSQIPEPEPEPVPVPAPAPAHRERDRTREPRHVRAVPTNDDHKSASAALKFNRTEHCRTIAGVARSLGAPVVNLTPDPGHPSVVWIVASWELCWYRYEVDLSDDGSGVRLDGQGYELSELAEHELIANAVADESGQLTLA